MLERKAMVLRSDEDVGYSWKYARRTSIYGEKEKRGNGGLDVGSEEVGPESADGEIEEGGEGEKRGRLFGEGRGSMAVGGEREEKRHERVGGVLKQGTDLRVQLD